MWPDQPNTDPFGELPTPVLPFDLDLEAWWQYRLDPSIDQPEATRRAWQQYGESRQRARRRSAAAA